MESEGTEVVVVHLVSLQVLDLPVVPLHLIAVEHIPKKVALGLTHLEHLL